jgi:vacuolar protein sorting-associated protein 29
MASNFGELVLLLGDHHLPSRTTTIPEQFQRMLVPHKMQHVICTGNIECPEELDRLRELVGGSWNNVHVVAGDYYFAQQHQNQHQQQNQMQQLDEKKVVQLGQFRIGIIGGHQVVPWGDLSALSMTRRQMNVDVLVCGSRRKEGVVQYQGGYYIFPGSITGAYSSSSYSGGEDEKEEGHNPSFILLAVQGNTMVCYVYCLKDGEVDVSKTEFSK